MTVITTIGELRAYVGEELSVSGWLEITQALVNQFADATGDHQWIHVDVERARRESPFGGTIAHGYLTLALHFPSPVEGVELQLATRMNVNYGLNRVRFISPVRVGKRVRSRLKLVSLDEISDGVYQGVRQNTVEIEGEAKPALVSEHISRFYFK